MNLPIDNINGLIEECEPMIISATSRAPRSLKEEIKQEMRMKIWELILSECKTYKDVIERVHWRIGSIFRTCSYVTKKKHRRYNNRFIPMDFVPTEYILLDPAQEDFVQNEHAQKILQALLPSLDERELFLVNYMLLTDNVDVNYDRLMRQTGYTGKGSVKYTFLSIQRKMRDYAEQNNIQISF